MPEHVIRYAFKVYDPPEVGLPWLAVCIGPDGKLLAAEAFDTREGAYARTIECTKAFVNEVDIGKRALSSATPLMH